MNNGNQTGKFETMGKKRENKVMAEMGFEQVTSGLAT